MVVLAMVEATGALSDGPVEVALDGPFRSRCHPLGLAGPAVDLQAGLVHLEVMESLLL